MDHGRQALCHLLTALIFQLGERRQLPNIFSGKSCSLLKDMDYSVSASERRKEKLEEKLVGSWSDGYK